MDHHFEVSDDSIRVYRDNGDRFQIYMELMEALRNSRQAVSEADEARQRADEARQQAEERAERLAARLRAMGIDPEDALGNEE